MRIQTITFYVFLLLCFSCTSQLTEKLEKNKKLVLSDSIKIRIDSTLPTKIYFTNFYEDNNGNEYLGVENRRINGIHIFDINKNKEILKYSFSSDGENPLERIGGLFVKNLDSIFVFSVNLTRIYLLDSKGNIKDKIVLKDSLNNRKFFGYLAYMGARPMMYKNMLDIGTVPYLDPSDTAFFSEKERLGVRIDLKTKKFTFNNQRYSSIYRNKLWGSDHVLYFRTITPNNQFVYSFAIDPTIYVEEGKRTTSYLAKSSEHKKILPNKGDDFIRYYIENDFYGEIIYDKYQKKYYRIVQHGLPYNNDKGGYNMPDDKIFSVLILDERFNKIGETFLPPNKYYVNDIFVNKKGLCISTAHPKNKSTDENYLSYHCFQVK